MRVWPQAGMTQRFWRVLGPGPGLAGLQSRWLTALLVRDRAPTACPIIVHVVITGWVVFDSPIPDHSVPATGNPHVGERKSVQGSALILVTAREQFKVGDTPQLLRFRLRVRVMVGHRCLDFDLVSSVLLSAESNKGRTRSIWRKGWLFFVAYFEKVKVSGQRWKEEVVHMSPGSVSLTCNKQGQKQ